MLRAESSPVTTLSVYEISPVFAVEEEFSSYGHVDIKEHGGDEAKMRAELEKLNDFEVIAYRPSDDDKVLKFGK